MIKNVDFDKLFDDFLNDYLAETLGKVKPEAIEKEIPAKYVEWMCSPCKELGDKTPHQFIEDLKSNGKLGEYLLSYVKADQDISDVIAEACGESEVDVLVEIMRDYPDYACPACAILKDIPSTKADKVILDIVLNPESSEALVDMAIEMLSESMRINDQLGGNAYYRGVALLSLEKYEEAIADFTKSIEQQFLPQFCYYNRGVCYVQLLDYEKAIEDMGMTLSSGSDEGLIAAAKDILWQLASYYQSIENANQ